MVACFNLQYRMESSLYKYNIYIPYILWNTFYISPSATIYLFIYLKRFILYCDIAN